MKFIIWLGVFVGGTIGGWVGAMLSEGNWLSLWSVLLSGFGSIAGIWISYKLSQNYLQ